MGSLGKLFVIFLATWIVYYLKFLLRAESCRDYVDDLLSLKRQPNIVIVDMADIFANHANNNRKEETENTERQTKREDKGRVASSDDSEFIRLSK